MWILCIHLTKLRLIGMQLPEKYIQELRRFERRPFVGKLVMGPPSGGAGGGVEHPQSSGSRQINRELKHVGRQHDNNGNQYNESMKRNK
jgi:hypothetical protein